MVSDEWKNDFKSFYDWCMANGWRRGLEIDKDIKGNGLIYSSEMCCIVTRKENANKKRSNVILTVDGISKTAAQWADISGINGGIIRGRVRAGWDHKRAVFYKPIKP